MAKNKKVKRRNIEVLKMILRTGNHAGPHKNRDYDLKKGRSRKKKHKKKCDD